MSEAFKRFGVFLTEDQTKLLLKLYRDSEGPMMGVSYRHTLNVAQRMDEARAEYHTQLDKYAMELGLPEPKRDLEGAVCHYGVDFQNREVLGMLEEPS